MKNTHSKKSSIIRFLIIVAVVVAYAGFAIVKFGLHNGLAVTGLTWSFFVFATPIADAGFLVGFPLRLLLGIRMFRAQIGVWLAALAMNAVALIVSPAMYDKTSLLRLFYDILTTPWPLWTILVLSTVGTYVSIRFEDDAMDIVSSKHKKALLAKRKQKTLLNLGTLALTAVLYGIVLATTHIHISLI